MPKSFQPIAGIPPCALWYGTHLHSHNNHDYVLTAMFLQTLSVTDSAFERARNMFMVSVEISLRVRMARALRMAGLPPHRTRLGHQQKIAPREAAPTLDIGICNLCEVLFVTAIVITFRVVGQKVVSSCPCPR